jgi:hypothetical protein
MDPGSNFKQLRIWPIPFPGTSLEHVGRKIYFFKRKEVLQESKFK